MKLKHLLQFIGIAVLSLGGVACSSQDDVELPPQVKDPEIQLGAIVTELSSRWLTEGDKLNISISEFNYTCSDPDVELTTISVENDGEIIASRPYRSDFSISITAGNWNHGENELTLIATFTTPTGEISKEFMHPKIIIFDELPRYDIEGIIEKDIKWLASNGEKFQHAVSIQSDNHIFRIGSITWTASNGEKFQFNKLSDMVPTFYINREATNFDADITSTELHWFKPNGPAVPSQDDYLSDEALLYGDFTVTGIHEGIVIEVTPSIVFRLIGSNKEK